MHSSHFGAFTAAPGDDGLEVRPYAGDADPSPLLGNLDVAATGRARVDRPYVRRGWLEDGPGPDPRRGRDEFVPMDWQDVVPLLARELRRVYATHGPAAVFGGSYGWGSAGRFHHAQSQVHRFLGSLGGYTGSVETYSLGAGRILLQHVVGSDAPVSAPTTWPVLAEHTELFVCFGGMPPKNGSVNSGGVTRHRTAGALREARRRGARFVLVSPIRDDLAGELDAEWLPVVPATDTALMLALAYVLERDGLADGEFLRRYCVGYDRVRAYLVGEEDGVAKSPAWAAQVCGVPAEEIERLAHRMAGHRTLVTATWSLQRARYGEQPVWMGLALAAMLGQLGVPGGGFGHGYGALAGVGNGRVPGPLPTLPRGRNPVGAPIPVARVADALLHPGEPYEFDGERRTYPDLRLVYWCGGNPFHHHQDLTRLRRAFARPETVVVHDPFWTASARHADVVLPSTITLERDDIGAAREDDLVVAMHRTLPRYGEARDDYEIFAALAGELGVADAFTEGRTTEQWLRHLFDRWRRSADRPEDFDAFWSAGEIALRAEPPRHVLFERFRADPDAHPLRTPSGRIELWSSTVAGFGYDDCPGHPVWLEPEEWLGAPAAARYPLHLVANNPATRLHSQLDHGGYSAASKVRGREPVRMHPDDAAARGLRDGDVVRVFNDRGACLAGLVCSTALRRGVVQLSTGAWYDPDADGVCVHGNPNVLTRDVGTSRLAQGCTGQHALVQVERYPGDPPPVTAYDPPPGAASGT
ncbi:MAG: molybdopterin-dependent oxidoreductase [Acidothermales bacterium]|nr:molybdopterin-dependent oxidoreductase [Acidothermales bacterium]